MGISGQLGTEHPCPVIEKRGLYTITIARFAHESGYNSPFIKRSPRLDFALKNWISTTKINALLEASSQNFDGVKARRVLIEYCSRYQENYPFDILDAPLEFLINDGKRGAGFNAVRAELEVAAGEYCLSLNEIAEALLQLIDTQHLTTEQAKKIINHVFEAFSCNESPEHFLQSEDVYLCEKLFAITANPETV